MAATEAPVVKPSSVSYWPKLAYKMLRARTVIMMLIFTAIGQMTVQPTQNISYKFILAGIMLGSLFISATCLNDIADKEIDAINLANDPSRPLITAGGKESQLKRLAFCALVVAAVSAVFIQPAALLLALAATILSYTYSMPPTRISYRGMYAALLLPLSYVVIPFLTGTLIPSAPIPTSSWPIAAGLYVTFIGRILLKDFRDYKGDKKFGKRTFLVRHGPRLTCFVAAWMWLDGDAVITTSLYKEYPVFVILAQPLVIIIIYALYVLAYEKQFERQLQEVVFIGRIGNALAVALLASLMLNAFDYALLYKNSLVMVISVFSVAIAIYLFQTSTSAVSPTPIKRYPIT